MNDVRIAPLNGIVRTEEKHVVSGSLQQIVSAVVTPGEEWMKTICKAIGPASFEGRFKEKITIRETT